MSAVLPDGSAFFIVDVPAKLNTSDPIKWNPGNKVVQDHRDGTIYHERTNEERAKRGLPTPWRSDMADKEVWGPDASPHSPLQDRDGEVNR